MYHRFKYDGTIHFTTEYVSVFRNDLGGGGGGETRLFFFEGRGRKIFKNTNKTNRNNKNT